MVTTDANHGLAVYPNLARDRVLTGIDQLWRADITYVRLETEFAYLAVVLDAFSRKVIGWALDRTLEATLAVEALRTALKIRKPAAGMVHHFDRGVQYASGDCIDAIAWPNSAGDGRAPASREITASVSATCGCADTSVLIPLTGVMKGKNPSRSIANL